MGADFSNTDIRGADFSGANLQDAKFCNVRAGLQKKWVWILVGLSWLISGISGHLIAILGIKILSTIDDIRKSSNQINGLFFS